MEGEVASAFESGALTAWTETIMPGARDATEANRSPSGEKRRKLRSANRQLFVDSQRRKDIATAQTGVRLVKKPYLHAPSIQRSRRHLGNEPQSLREIVMPRFNQTQQRALKALHLLVVFVGVTTHSYP